jgi:hypothetical protein
MYILKKLDFFQKKKKNLPGPYVYPPLVLDSAFSVRTIKLHRNSIIVAARESKFKLK